MNPRHVTASLTAILLLSLVAALGPGIAPASAAVSISLSATSVTQGQSNTVKVTAPKAVKSCRLALSGTAGVTALGSVRLTRGLGRKVIQTTALAVGSYRVKVMCGTARAVWSTVFAVTRPPTVAPATGRVDDSEIVARVASANCSGLLPKGWTLSDFQGTAADALAPDASAAGGVSWWVVSDLRRSAAAASGFNPDLQSPDPLTSALGLLSGYRATAATTFVTTGPESSMGVWHGYPVASPKYKGYLIYFPWYPPQGSGGSGGSGDYVNVIRYVTTVPATPDATMMRYLRAALSITCSPTPSQSSGGLPPDSEPPAPGSDSTYNMQLETDVVHDPGTGQTYTVPWDQQSSSACGSGVAGYWKQVGNGCTVLSPGYAP